MGGFKALGLRPNTKVAVFVFGLVYGFGLATKLQEYSLSRNGLVANIVSFNGGVEIGQFLALTAVLLALGYWRTRPGYVRARRFIEIAAREAEVSHKGRYGIRLPSTHGASAVP